MEKPTEEFRNYENSLYQDRVERTYRLMHTNQTVEFVRNRLEYWTSFNHAELTVMEACDLLNQCLDETDPDINLPNSVHAFQTAEGIRKAHPDLDWFHLVGLIHDLGKVMTIWGEQQVRLNAMDPAEGIRKAHPDLDWFHLVGLIHDLGKVMTIWGEQQWATGGDTYPVGCRPSENIIFGLESFKGNPDMNHEVYSTKLGIYDENCGLENVLMSWGHDEYLYQVLKATPHSRIPEEGLYMIRYHSFYPWHTGGEYRYLSDEKDEEMLDWILEFNKYDLYTKSSEVPDVEALRPYYQSLIDKYLPGKIKF